MQRHNQYVADGMLVYFCVVKALSVPLIYEFVQQRQSFTRCYTFQYSLFWLILICLRLALTLACTSCNPPPNYGEKKSTFALLRIFVLMGGGCSSRLQRAYPNNAVLNLTKRINSVYRLDCMWFPVIKKGYVRVGRETSLSVKWHNASQSIRYLLQKQFFHRFWALGTLFEWICAEISWVVHAFQLIKSSIMHCFARWWTTDLQTGSL